MRWGAVGVALLVALGTAEAAPRKARARRTVSPAARAAARASQWVGLRTLWTVSPTVNDDCSGLTRLAFRGQDVQLLPEEVRPGEGGVQAIYRRARALKALRRSPRRGDLVFFRETYDRNRDGRRNDGLTHIGIVERVQKDGTVVFIHRAEGGVKRSRLHLHKRVARKDARGRVLNDWLRRGERGQRGRYTGELLAGFARVDARWRQAPPATSRMARAQRGSTRGR